MTAAAQIVSDIDQPRLAGAQIARIEPVFWAADRLAASVTQADPDEVGAADPLHDRQPDQRSLEQRADAEHGKGDDGDETAGAADEAILLNTRGMLVEGSGSNLFLVVAGRLSTPGPATGCLPGVTRALVTELIEVAERDDLTVDDLRLAPEAFLTSTTRGVQPISSVDGEPLRSAPGPLTTAARTALDKLRAATLEP